MLFSKKNIDKKLRDVVSPEKSYNNNSSETFFNDFHVNKKTEKDFMNDKKFNPYTRTGLRWFIVGALGVALIGGTILYGFIIVREGKFLDSATSELLVFNDAMGDLEEFNLNAALETLKNTQKPTLSFSDSPSLFSAFLQSIRPTLKEGGEALNSFRSMTEGLLNLVKVFVDFRDSWTDLVFRDGGGEELIEKIKTLRVALQKVRAGNSSFTSSFITLRDDISPEFNSYAALGLEFDRFLEFVTFLEQWLASTSERHLAVFLENPSEMRPGGGFIGSYIDIAVRGGNIIGFRVYDINEVDRTLALNIIPPKPLQVITAQWGAADANWFFDFSSSASKVLELMEESKFYHDQGIVFDGAIGVGAFVLEDLLGLLGPLSLPKYGITLQKENFLLEIQKHVQQKQAEDDEEPKAILHDVAVAFMDRLSKLTSAEKEALLVRMNAWLSHRDIRIYFKDSDAERFFDAYGWSGKVASLPKNFVGDYFAFAFANIGGGKTDTVINQNILFQSTIDEDGRVANHVVVERTHTGAKNPYWWYRMPSEGYARIFTPLGSRLQNMQGGFTKKIPIRAYYNEIKFTRDSDIQALEESLQAHISFPYVDTFQESQKSVFATWFAVQPGKTNELVFDYERMLPSAVYDGIVYTFIFEKQSGMRAHYAFELHAPVGYRWKENKLPVYEYATNDPLGRTTIKLTLEKNSQ